MAVIETIKSASIARVTSKEGKFLGFLVKSNHTEDFYQVTCLKINGHCEFFCNCKGFKFHGHCCHVKACEELCAARKELAQAEKKQEAIIKANDYRRELEKSPWNGPYCSTSNLAPCPALKAKETAVKRAPQFQNMEALKALPLNGNAGFSLLKVS